MVQCYREKKGAHLSLNLLHCVTLAGISVLLVVKIVPALKKNHCPQNWMLYLVLEQVCPSVRIKVNSFQNLVV